MGRLESQESLKQPGDAMEPVAQAAACERPYLLLSIPGAGHYSYGVTPDAQVESQTQMLAFLIRALGLEERRLGER